MDEGCGLVSGCSTISVKALGYGAGAFGWNAARSAVEEIRDNGPDR